MGCSRSFFQDIGSSKSSPKRISIAVQRNTNHFRQSCYTTMMFRSLQFHICETSIIRVTNTVL
uniref:Uncharacterized protein n=1 Tax=Solanum tuberosum TaxID=4113 RepID=M1APM7_SOLTU